MSKTYMKRTCWICKREISCSGLAQASHMRSHVRKGEVVERLHKLGGDLYTTFHRPPTPSSQSLP